MRSNGDSRSGGPESRSSVPVSFLGIDLRYGRHDGSFELDSRGAPVVIAGPNGSGKSTIIEGLVRTLFGFRRSLREDRETHRRRKPWAGGPYEGRLRLETTRGIWTFERDFESDRVRVVAPGGSAPRFEGEANPTRSGESIRRYRALLEEALGLSELKDYRRTACIFQGGLPVTSLGPDLLRVAAGGHADVETARERLREEYRALTTEPIADGVARRRTPGAIQVLEARVADLETAAREARAAEARRGPRVRERDACRSRIAAAQEELETLDDAFEILSEAARLEEMAESSRARVRRLEGWMRELDEALARYDLARERRLDPPGPAFPADFPERARALEAGLWPRREALRAEIAEPAAAEGPTGLGPWFRAAAASPVLLAASVLLWLAGARVAAGVVFGLALTVGVLAVTQREKTRRDAEVRRARRRRIEAELAALEGEIAETLREIPDGARLDPSTLAVARDRYRREAADREAVQECARALRAAIDGASRTLGESGDETTRERSVERVPGGLAERARDRLRLLHDAAAREREEFLAPLKLRLEEIRRVRLDLPDGVEPSAEGVRSARRARVADGDRLRSELTAIERELAVGARPAVSAVSLEAELETARSELARLRARARAYRRAYRLIEDAYESFRRTDEERLVGAISSHVDAISDGALGPLEVAKGLDGARLRLGGRSAPIAAPPLSYGQLHAAFLAIRMGAADFLAGLGVRVPLLLDDPFVHLDERSAGHLWGILERVAGERQVIVATQDRLLLEHLDIAPDVALAAAPPVPEAAPDLRGQLES